MSIQLRAMRGEGEAREGTGTLGTASGRIRVRVCCWAEGQESGGGHYRPTTLREKRVLIEDREFEREK